MFSTQIDLFTYLLRQFKMCQGGELFFLHAAATCKGKDEK